MGSLVGEPLTSQRCFCSHQFEVTRGPANEGLTLHSLEVSRFPTASVQIFDILLHYLIVSELYGDCWFSFKVFAEGSKLCSGQQILLT